MRTLSLSIALLSLCTAQTVFAQSAESSSSASSESGSGEYVRTTQDVVDTIRELLPWKNPKKLKDVQVPETKQTAWENSLADIRERQATHRRNCRESVRRANRDQLMPTLNSCYKADLQLDITMLREQLLYVQAVPGSDATLRAAATGAIFTLIDAENTIINAIDTGLFTKQEALEEAKRNLRATYRVPYWFAMTRVRADWELTWIAFMVKNIEERLAENDVPGARKELANSATLCLETGAQMLLGSLTTPDRVGAATELSAAQLQLKNCRQILSSLARRERLDTEENSASTQSSSSIKSR